MSNFNKLFILKSVLFIGIIYFLQTIIVMYFPLSLPKDVEKFQVKIKNGVDILYFGDSVMRDTYGGDTDKRQLFEMFADYFPSKKIISQDHMAYHAGIYEAYLEFLLKNDKSYYPSVVVIPINLRSFSPEWDMRPMYQFEQEKLYLKYSNSPVNPFLKFLIATKVLNNNPITDTMYMQTPVYFGKKKIGIVEDFEQDHYKNPTKEKLKNKSIYYYLYSLPENHRKLESLVNMGKLLKGNNIEAIFYITPIDIESGEEILPGEFKKQAKENTSVIENKITSYGFSVVNLAFDLPSSFFNWGSPYMSEHLKDKGRQYVAKKVTEEIIKRNKLKN